MESEMSSRELMEKLTVLEIPKSNLMFSLNSGLMFHNLPGLLRKLTLSLLARLIMLLDPQTVVVLSTREKFPPTSTAQ